jgi:hypothetical protein
VYFRSRLIDLPRGIPVELGTQQRFSVTDTDIKEEVGRVWRKMQIRPRHTRVGDPFCDFLDFFFGWFEELEDLLGALVLTEARGIGVR